MSSRGRPRRGYAAPASPWWAVAALVSALALVGTTMLRRRSADPNG
jgi:hypothetical protein